MKKTLSRTLIVSILAFCTSWLVSCANDTAVQTAQTAEAIAKAKLADRLIQSGDMETAFFSTDLSEEEMSVYIQAIDKYNEFRNLWSENPDIAFQLLETQYIELMVEYYKVVQVVTDNWKRYPPAAQTKFRAFELYAVTIQEGAASAAALRDKQEMIARGVELGTLMFEVAKLVL